MKLYAKILAGCLGAAVLLGPVGTATAAVADPEEDNLSMQISSAKLVRDSIVVQGTYTCDAPYKARFIEAQATQNQGEDGETEVTAFKSLRDRPCIGGKRQFQATLNPSRGSRFVSSERGGSNVFVQVEIIITDQDNRYEDALMDYADVAV